MQITYSTESAATYSGEVVCLVFDPKTMTRHRVIRTFDTAFKKRLLPTLESLLQGVKAKKIVTLPTYGQVPVTSLVCVALTERGSDAYRVAGARIIREIRAVGAKRVGLVIPATFSLTKPEEAEAFLEGLFLGSYQFHVYKTVSPTDQLNKAVQIELCGIPVRDRAAWLRLIERARALADAIMLARDLVNTPSGDMHPFRLAEVAEEVVMGVEGCTAEPLSLEKMTELGMEATLAVARGSVHEPRGMHLVYRPKGRARKRIVIIGKAVTFDSGGLSIKSADGMMTMKIDMAGAASVIGLFKVLPTLKLPFEVHGIFLGVENMPSGNAYRPGDVVKAMNGKTIEVLNTDAEGRLTLADALSYAVTLKPDTIIDLATLTGACVVALGEEIAGLFSADSSLTKALLRAGEQANEPLWSLPLYAPYKELIASRVADLKNVGGRAAGALTAALFLTHFVGSVPWAHVDIAGPSYAEKETRPDLPFGATGFGVRLLVRYLQGLSGAKR